MNTRLSGPKTPWHLWVVGILAVLFNAGGIISYTATELRLDAVMSQFSDAERAYFYGFPAWAVGVWAIGVWCAFLGSVLILFRSKWAVVLIALSFIGLVGTTYYEKTAEVPASLDTPGNMVFAIIIWAQLTFLLIYTWSMRGKGVLR